MVKQLQPPRTSRKKAAAVIDVEDAWRVHRALLLAQARDPSLATSPRFQLLRMDAYEVFHDLLARSRRG